MKSDNSGDRTAGPGADGSYWVFGYGSLIWRPGFAYRSVQPALLRGAHRRLCVFSHRYRGTPERPGLVFGLKRGGSCRGVAFEVAAQDWPQVWDYLQEREQSNRVYSEVMWRVRLADGREVRALCFVVDERHVQYAGPLDVAQQLEHVRSATGQMGPNRDYVLNTAQHLSDLGIRDKFLATLSAKLTEK